MCKHHRHVGVVSTWLGWCLDVVPTCCAGRVWSGPDLQEVAQDMFNDGKLIVENGNSQPMDACSPTPDWNAPLRCYAPAMFNAEVRLVCLISDLQ